MIFTIEYAAFEDVSKNKHFNINNLLKELTNGILKYLERISLLRLKIEYRERELKKNQTIL